MASKEITECPDAVFGVVLFNIIDENFGESCSDNFISCVCGFTDDVTKNKQDFISDFERETIESFKSKPDKIKLDKFLGQDGFSCG